MAPAREVTAPAREVIVLVAHYSSGMMVAFALDPVLPTRSTPNTLTSSTLPPGPGTILSRFTLPACTENCQPLA